MTNYNSSHTSPKIESPNARRVLPVYKGRPRRYPWRLWDFRRRAPVQDKQGRPKQFTSETQAREFAQRESGLLYEPERAGA